MRISQRAGLLLLLCVPSVAIAQQGHERPQLEVEAANQAIDKFEAGLRKLLNDLTQELDDVLVEQTKLGKLDEAIAVRDAKHFYETARMMPTNQHAKSASAQQSRSWIELRRRATFDLKRERRRVYETHPRDERRIEIEKDDDGKTLWVVGTGV